MRKIYVASSWRNQYQDLVVKFLRLLGHSVYDFKNPAPGNNGFSWKQINHGWGTWGFDEYKEALNHPIAIAGYQLDFGALQTADTCVLVLPSGRSAHIEAGYMIGQGKRTIVYVPGPETIEPELMYKLAYGLTNNLHDIDLMLRD